METIITIQIAEMEHSKNTGLLLGGLLLGAAIGGALGILFAPEKGSDTRKKIVGNSDELTDAFKDKFNSFMNDIKQEVQSITHKANEAVENGLNKADKVKMN